ncbi:MAG: prepilin-type N-terminal cleavage/methylation domain-containing protein [Candidatus Saccharibacteria bacterium]
MVYKNRGFTIVELLVVIVVIGILAAITIVSYTGISQRATVASLQSDLTNASNILKLDQVVGSGYPASLAAANSGKGVKSSPGTTLRYGFNNNVSPQTFCLSATNGTTSYKITNDSASTSGDCINYGLVLYLDAENISSYPGTGTTWTDLSGNATTNALVGGVTYTPGDHGAFTFDGTTGYVNLSNVSRASLTNCSVTFWRKSVDNTQWLILGGQNTSYFLMAISSGAFYHGNAGSSVLTYQDGVTSTTDNRNSVWHQYVATGVNLSSWTSLYLNNYFTGGWGYKGLLQDFRIYNRVLNPTEIQQNFTDTRNRFGV